jgi:hypothetical protein
VRPAPRPGQRADDRHGDGLELRGRAGEVRRTRPCLQGGWRRCGLRALAQELKASVGITGTLASHGVKPEHIPRMVEIAVKDICHQTNPRPCTAADFERLFQAAM